MNVVVPARIDELRTRGFSEDVYTSQELEDIERKVWEVIKLFTNRDFELQTVTLAVDGTGTDTLFLPLAISSITSITETDEGTISLTDIVYQNRVIPDDREKPYVFRLAGVFPEGKQNVSISGVFGYVDPKSPENFPPEPLIEVAIRLMPFFVEPVLENVDVRAVDIPVNKREIKSETSDRWTYVKHYKELLKNSLLEDSFVNAILLKYRKGDDIIYGGAV